MARLPYGLSSALESNRIVIAYKQYTQSNQRRFSMFNFSSAALLATILMAAAGAVQAQAGAQAAKGQRLWQQRCAECHAVDADETGPRHRGVFGRRAGSIEGYDYSRALRSADIQWDEASLERWLRDPEQFIPGQNMDFKVRSKAERTALIAFLKNLSPVPATRPAP
jgi:cytochrome c